MIDVVGFALRPHAVEKIEPTVFGFDRGTAASDLGPGPANSGVFENAFALAPMDADLLHRISV